MALANDSHVQVATDGSGKKIDNAVLVREPTTQGGTGETVYRQRTVIADDSNPRLQMELQGEAGDAKIPVTSNVLQEIHFELVQIRETLQLLIG